jgi:hypothetical protein
MCRMRCTFVSPHEVVNELDRSVYARASSAGGNTAGGVTHAQKDRQCIMQNRVVEATTQDILQGKPV